MNRKVIFLTTDSMGNGERELGTQLLETFLTLLKQREPEQLPAAVFCVNRGVLALTEQSFASLHLKELANRGVPVLACGTCVNYYGIQDQLAAGEVSSMGYFMELAEQYEVLTLS
ncbi:MAG: DsrE family protein [Paenibacillus sp.]|jgi:intracellular sulfur oxidation DsrE/DsrF family protein|uniref:DsrE family protein n=1 Tax=Paenibacillus sp. TaxID=58172 RepID=UPI002909CD4D|nr:DsrE family protein [Paenibacillus sp.]MDU4694332.1 DsrE family protein [Paenibacillus sp.]